MSSENRRLSLTLSEDDLRPHMRRKKTKKEESEVVKLTEKYEKLEQKKEEIRKKIEKEEKAKEEERKRQILDQEIAALWEKERSRDDVGGTIDKPGMRGSRGLETSPFDIPNRRRFNNSRYFNWDSDEEIVPDVPKPRSRQETKPETFESTLSGHDNCELCHLAHQSIQKHLNNQKMSGKSAACAHVDLFLSKMSQKF